MGSELTRKRGFEGQRGRKEGGSWEKGCWSGDGLRWVDQEGKGEAKCNDTDNRHTHRGRESTESERKE